MSDSLKFTTMSYVMSLPIIKCFLPFGNSRNDNSRKRKRTDEPQPKETPTKKNIRKRFAELVERRSGSKYDEEKFGKYLINPLNNLPLLYMVKMGHIHKVGSTRNLYSRFKQLSNEYSSDIKPCKELEVVSVFEMKTGDEEIVIHKQLREEFKDSLICSYNGKKKTEIYSSVFLGDKILDRAKILAGYLDLVELRRQN